MADIKAEYLACPIRQVVSRFGDKWSMLVLYMLHTSETGVLRFNEIRRLMTDCSQKMLSQTLKNLEQSHLVHREVYPEVPPRVEYSLTDTGKSLMPALTALIAWGKEHFNEVVQINIGTINDFTRTLTKMQLHPLFYAWLQASPRTTAKLNGSF